MLALLSGSGHHHVLGSRRLRVSMSSKSDTKADAKAQSERPGRGRALGIAQPPGKSAPPVAHTPGEVERLQVLLAAERAKVSAFSSLRPCSSDLPSYFAHCLRKSLSTQCVFRPCDHRRSHAQQFTAYHGMLRDRIFRRRISMRSWRG